MRIKKDNIYILGILINPFIAVGKIYDYLSNPKKINPLIFALFIGMIGMNFIPNENLDLFRHYEYYNSVKIVNFNPLNEKYFGLGIIVFVLKKMSLPKETLPFISLFFFYLMFFDLAKRCILRKNQFSRVETISYILVILFIPGFPMMLVYSGIRFFLGGMIIAYILILYYLYGLSKMRLLLGFTLAICLHNTLVFIIPIFILGNLLKLKKNEKKIRLLMYIIIFILSIFVDYTKLGVSVMEMFNMKTAYITGNSRYGMGGFIKTFVYGNFYGKVQFVLESMLYLLIPYVYLSKLKIKNKLQNYMIIKSYILLFMFQQYDFFKRYTGILMILVIFDLFRRKEKNTKYYLWIMLGLKAILLSIFWMINYEFIMKGLSKTLLGIQLLKLFDI